MRETKTENIMAYSAGVSREQESVSLLDRIVSPLVVLVEKYYPDVFVFTILLSFLTLALVLGTTAITPVEALDAWGHSLSSLLAFGSQMAFMVIAAFALAHTALIQQLLHYIGRVPTTAFRAYVTVVLCAGLFSYICWPLGLIAGAIIARNVAAGGAERGLKLHYPLLVASAYGGFVIWHMGYSSSAALFVATPGNGMEDAIGGLIPVTETIFSGWNLLIALVTLTGVAIICACMHPSKNRLIEYTPSPESPQTESADPATDRPVAKLENTRVLPLLVAALIGAYLISWFTRNGFSLTLDVVNWSLLCAGLLLCNSAKHYIDLITDGARTVGPILLLYPFYAGIMGVMMDSGLVNTLSDWFASVATEVTLPFWAFVSAGVVNIFIPSGGAQWAVQGPVFVEAAKALEVDISLVVMGVAYGDQWSNMIQPLPMIPLLAIAGLKLKHIMGYTFIIFGLCFFIFGGGLLLVASL
ncbi:TIGR00366 family protein [Pseudomaricurvus alkylphenolicus]|uniref:TIGR00366 family protein n=1 Tax=Pseudomaricurvus alkylphenolicus TaxID=1306991 RepID=UPI0019812748